MSEIKFDKIQWLHDAATDCVRENRRMSLDASEVIRYLTAPLLALRERAEPEFYGPYTPVMMGAGVWVSIADELPPHLEGRKVWVTTSQPISPPAPVVPDLYKVIYHFRDLNEGFPVERFKADYVIAWMLANYPPAPPAPVVPTFEEWCQRNGQKPVGWVREAMKEAYEACRAAMLAAPGKTLGSKHKDVYL
ncbi:hypothetical protein ACI1AV_000302 [Cronobacter turicensis]